MAAGRVCGRLPCLPPPSHSSAGHGWGRMLHQQNLALGTAELLLLPALCPSPGFVGLLCIFPFPGLGLLSLASLGFQEHCANLQSQQEQGGNLSTWSPACSLSLVSVACPGSGADPFCGFLCVWCSGGALSPRLGFCGSAIPNCLPWLQPALVFLAVRFQLFFPRLMPREADELQFAAASPRAV